ncbi:unnamed protein product [Sympodiomycopsis kandeliae]
MRTTYFIVLAALAAVSATASETTNQKRLVDGFDTVTEPLTGSETQLDPKTHKEVKPSPASTKKADKDSADKNTWKYVPNIKGPAGFATGHIEYNSQMKRDVSSYPQDIENANDRFNKDFKNHHIEASVHYADDILRTSESYTGDVMKMAHPGRRDDGTADEYDPVQRAKEYADTIQAATDKYIEDVADKPVAASSEYTSEILKATADYTSDSSKVRKVKRGSLRARN